jgi:hypothetical protein
VHCVRSGQIPETFVQVERSVRPSSPLLIRGFGVRVPGGAPVFGLVNRHPVIPSSRIPCAGQQREQQRASFAAPVLVSVIIFRILPERPGHALGGYTGHFRGDVAVGVHGQRDLAMTEDLHHHPGGTP